MEHGRVVHSSIIKYVILEPDCFLFLFGVGVVVVVVPPFVSTTAVAVASSLRLAVLYR